MSNYLNTKLNLKVEKTLNNISFLNSSMINQMYKAANYTTNGKISNAPLWSKRGHLAELHHQFTFMINSAVSMANDHRFGISTDKVGINMSKVSRNNPLVDVTVYDAYKNDYYNYQSKICKTPEASIKAATGQKYVDNNIIPLVPQGHSDKYDRIEIDGISSDPISVEKLDTVTHDYSSGNVYSYITDKRPDIFYNSIKYSVYSGLTNALHKQFFKIIGNIINDEQNSESFGEHLAEFALDSINEIFYSSANVGLTLLTGEALLSSVVLSTFKDAVINFKLYLDGNISFDDFIINVAVSAVTSTVATGATLLLSEGANSLAIKKLIPVFKFVGIVLAAVVVSYILLYGFDLVDPDDSRRIRVQKEREMLYSQYCTTKENVYDHFNQLTSQLQSVMGTMVKNVLYYSNYFDRVNMNILDIDLSNEAVYYDELSSFSESLSNLSVKFISIDELFKLL